MNNSIFTHLKKHASIALVATSCLLMIACSNSDSLKSVPIGKLSALEDLADSYNQVAEQFPMNIAALPPPQKREFLEQVFKKTGYDYSATLLNMGASALDKTNKNQKDLAQLVLLPTQGISNDAVSDFYSDDEMQAIKKIRSALQ